VDHLPDCKTLVILDVEMTAWEGSCARGWSEPWEEREIIQIGMLALDRETLNPLDDFSCFVKPKINPELSDYIIDLTTITQETLEKEGTSLAEAFAKSAAFIAKLPTPLKVVSNGTDGPFLVDNAALEQIDAPDFFKNCPSIRPLLKAHISGYTQDHFSCDLADLVGRPIEGQKHTVLYDVESIAEALRYIRDAGLV
jgi:inhibitor of KinA sporulation pathway (predicted exonuclease)